MSTIDWATLASIATCLAALATLVSIGMIVWQVSRAKKALIVNTCCGLFEFWVSEEWQRKRTMLKEDVLWPLKAGEFEPPASLEDMREIMTRIEEKHGENGRSRRTELNIILWSIWDFFEHMGVLVKHGGLDIKVVREYWEGIVPGYWEPFGDFIYDVREKEHSPGMLENFEWLYHTVKNS